LKGNLGTECFDESFKVGDATTASLKDINCVAYDCSVNVAVEQLCEQQRAHDFDLFHYLSPIMAMRVVNASPVMATYQSAGLVLRVRLNHTTPKRRPALPA